MTNRRPAGRTTRRRPTILIGVLLVVVAAITAALGQPWQPSRSSLAPSSLEAVGSAQMPPPPLASRSPGAPSSSPVRRGPLGEADGILPDGTSVFDDGYPGIAGVDPDLLDALRRAAADAAADGVAQVVVESGWRSTAYQDRLLREAVSTYGSVKEAARWVATSTTSAHVSGDAVDLGPANATAWLSLHGAGYGLCQIYRNEPWHYERRPSAIDQGCPRMYADPTHDPRMRR